jgi:UDP-N-acetylmuramoyl-tripeptide--D-alanyl-D-alanine ligase
MTFLPTLEHANRAFRKTPAGRATARARLARAEAHRRELGRTRFIGVTGSSAKTTTKELIAAVLSTELRGTKTFETSNTIGGAARAILRTGRDDDFSVVEVAASRVGTVAATAALLRPAIAVVTHVGVEHRKEFRSAEATAIEKRALVESAAGGVAVLNADDPLVAAMGDGFPGEVVTFGESAGATFRARDVSATWPERLAFTLEYDGRSVPVATQLCGTHWTSSVLAALAVGVQMGIAIERAVEAVAEFAPVEGRMSPVVDGGVTFIRDDWKAPYWSVGTAIDFIADARAARKILIFGTIGDYGGGAARVYRRVAELALAAADEVAFVGPQAERARKVKERSPDAPLALFATVHDAAHHFEHVLRDGDLVLLKASGSDHLERIVLTRSETVRCWRERCGRSVFCTACWLRRVPGGP